MGHSANFSVGYFRVKYSIASEVSLAVEQRCRGWFHAGLGQESCWDGGWSGTRLTKVPIRIEIFDCVPCLVMTLSLRLKHSGGTLHGFRLFLYLVVPCQGSPECNAGMGQSQSGIYSNDSNDSISDAVVFAFQSVRH